MCTVACPYARLQSVLLDRKSLVVAYDEHRGEPRGKKGKVPGACVDCSLCVDVCPTGIDIRNGLQLECITCAQCIDACDSVMDKLHRPRGLIRYTSSQALATRSFRWKSLVRPRVLVYPAILALLLTALGFASASRSVAEVSILRGVGAPFTLTGGLVENHVRIKVRNRTNAPVDYHFSVQGAPEARLVAPENPLRVAAGEQRTESVFVLSPTSTFPGGVRQVRIVVKGGADFERTTPYALLGPQSSLPAPEASAR
jgi:cytochrome c oxidase accessory protein FixG